MCRHLTWVDGCFDAGWEWVRGWRGLWEHTGHSPPALRPSPLVPLVYKALSCYVNSLETNVKALTCHHQMAPWYHLRSFHMLCFLSLGVLNKCLWNEWREEYPKGNENKQIKVRSIFEKLFDGSPLTKLCALGQINFLSLSFLICKVRAVRIIMS